MARSATVDQANALESLHRRTRIYAEVWYMGAWFDLTFLDGTQWVLDCSFSEPEGNTVPSATLTLRRETDTRSLAPLGGDIPFVREGSRIRLAVEVGSATGIPTGRVEMGEWRVDEVEWGGDQPEMVIQLREAIMARLHDYWLMEPLTVGPGALSELLQDVLDATLPSIELAVLSDPPGGFPEAGELREQSVQSALNSLVDQTGWILDRREVGGEFRLALSEPMDPTESPPAPVATLTPRRYFEVPGMAVSGIGVRDRVLVEWASGDGLTGGTVQVETPIPLFGPDEEDRLPIGFRLAGSGYIRTEAQALALARIALVTLGRAPVAMRVVLPFDWRWERGDWLRFEPNNVHHAQPFEGAVVSVEHRLTPGDSEDGGGETVLDIRGAYGGRITRWAEQRTRTRLRDEIEDVVGQPPLPPLRPIAPWYYTRPDQARGFSAGVDSPAQSLGGFISATPIQGAAPGSLNAIFGPISEEELLEGGTLYACVGLTNPDPDGVTWASLVARLRLEEDVDPGGWGWRWALDPAGVVELRSEDPQGLVIPDRETAPEGVDWIEPMPPDEEDPEWDPEDFEGQIGDIEDLHCQLVWLELSWEPGASPRTTDDYLEVEDCLPVDPEEEESEP